MSTKLFLNLICGISLIFISGCGLFSDDSLCGVEKKWTSNLGSEYSYESLDALTGNRIFIFEDISTPENICTDEHSRAEFNIGLKDNKFPSGTKATGKAYWGGFFEETVNLGPHDTYLEDLGLKEAFNGKPGWIGLQIIFEFPTQGSLEKDKIFFQEHVKHCTIYYHYKEHI